MTLRALRLVRLLRLLKLVRYMRALDRLRTALYDVRDELAVFLLLTVILLFLASVGLYQFEHEAQPEKFRSVFDALWWAVCTFSTVGYGDVYPVTGGGRFFTSVVLLLGVGVVAVPSGLAASALARAARREDPPPAGEA